MTFPSLIQQHGALTHFPIALLFVAVFFEILAAIARDAEKAKIWRRFSLWLIGFAFMGALPSLLTGWLYGRELARPPLQYDAHWKAAVIATILSGAVLGWRLLARDQLPPIARGVALCTTVLATTAVGWSGHLGGEMVFGEAGETVVIATPAPLVSREELRDQKLELFAEKMGVAADKIDLSTQKLALKTQPQTSPTPTIIVKEGAPQTRIVAAPPATVSTDALDRALEKLDRVAAKYDSVAQKLDRLADELAKSQSDARPATLSKTTPRQSPQLSIKQPKQEFSSQLQTSLSSTPIATAPTNAPEPIQSAKTEAQWIDEGKKFYFDKEIGCENCHKIGGKGGRGGPALDQTGSDYPDVEWHIAHLKNPASKVPSSKMPAYNDLNEQQLRAIAHFMVSLK